ncbi:hypothetical protein [Acinetobacter radioresistens]|nr:hypothetical protein [Acinetobacter radioresistens]MCX0339484.1 hypothetical protein [Acinetobacter radioresistens]
MSSPLIDLVNAADKATKSQASSRTQVLQAVAQGYQTYFLLGLIAPFF